MTAPVGASPVAGPDVAYTPVPVAWATVHALQVLHGRSRYQHGCPRVRHRWSVWEMHAGGGAFVDECERVGHSVMATDVDPAAPGLRLGAGPRLVHDACLGLPSGWERPDWIVGNPPWSETADHLRVAMATARLGIAWILPWAWIVPADRAWVAETAMPEWLLGFRERVSFGGPGRVPGRNPPRDCGLHIWLRNAAGGWMGAGRAGVISVEGGHLYLGIPSEGL